MDNEIILGEEQQEAIDQITKFINLSLNISFSLSGYAGTGKSFLIKYLVKYLELKNIQYVLCAPTHKAKVVLERFTDRDGMTLHKLLSLSPNIEIIELDFKDLKFLIGKNLSLFPKKGIIICDESSMINDDLFDLLTERCIENKCKAIFVGDKAQIQPVKADKHSKVFETEDRFVLSKIYRQLPESGLTSVLPILRKDTIPYFTTAIGTQGSLICTSDIKELFKQAIPIFKKAINNSDILEAKILAYTNNRVFALNLKMRDCLFSDKKEYNKSEFLTCYENLEFNNTKFWNSMDYIVIDEPLKTEVYIPGFISLPGYQLNLYDSSSKSSEEIFILSKEISKDYLDSLSQLIEQTRLSAISLKSTNKKISNQAWKSYYQIINSFTSPVDLYYNNRLIRKKSFDYGYATTVHRSQGSSINNTFIDMKNILLCQREEELRQLQYVAVSRTKTNAYILQ